MCRSRSQVAGGRRCSCDPARKRAQGRAKYAADAVAGTDVPASPVTGGDIVAVAETNRAALVAAWGERGAEIAEFVDVVPTVEELDGLYGDNLRRARAFVDRVTSATDDDLKAMSDAELSAIEFSSGVMLDFPVLAGEKDRLQQAREKAGALLRERGYRYFERVPGSENILPRDDWEVSLKNVRDKPETDWTDKERVAMKIAAMYDVEFPAKNRSTVRFQVTRISVSGRYGIRIGGSIVRTTRSGPQSRGHFQRHLKPPTEPDGSWSATADALYIQRITGQGLGTRFVRRNENAYIAAGFSHIDVDAGSTVGGYAWARAGYDWRWRGTGGDVPLHLREYKREHGDPDGQVQAMIDRLDDEGSDNYPTPMDVAMLGWTPGAETWPGKQIMTGSFWRGRKQLVPPATSATTRTATRETVTV